jgi:hypothetical protein
MRYEWIRQKRSSSAYSWTRTIPVASFLAYWANGVIRGYVYSIGKEHHACALDSSQKSISLGTFSSLEKAKGAVVLNYRDYPLRPEKSEFD